MSKSSSSGRPYFLDTELKLIFLVIIGAVLFKIIKKYQLDMADSSSLLRAGLFSILALSIVLTLWNFKKIRAQYLKFKLLFFKPSDATLIAKEGLYPVYIPDKLRLGHVQIIGATGRGKSYSVLEPMAFRDLLSDKDVIIIDGKGDLSLASHIIQGLKNHLGEDIFKEKIDTKILDFGKATGAYFVNPLAYGDSQQITDKILSVFEFENSYYKSVQKEALLLMTSLVKANEKEVSFELLYMLLTQDEYLIEFSKGTNSKEMNRKVFNYVQEKRSERLQKLSGLTSQLSDFCSESVGFHFSSQSSRELLIDIPRQLISEDKITKNRFIYISLPTLKYQKTAKILGKLLLQDLACAVGDRENLSFKKYTSVFLDEFSAFAYEDFYQILNKARSSNIALHLSHQSMGDLKIISQEFAEIVTTNTNVKCVLGINDPVTADYFAKLFGTHTVDIVSERVKSSGGFTGSEKTGDGSLREGEAYKVHPNKLKSYMNGRGVLHFISQQGPVTKEVQFQPIMKKGEE